MQVVCLFLLKETFAPAILAKKAARLQKLTGNLQLHTKWQGPDHSMKTLIMKSLVRPLIMLGTQPALQAMALFRAYQYGLMYLVLATFNRVFEGAYDQSVGRASLNYLSLRSWIRYRTAGFGVDARQGELLLVLPISCSLDSERCCDILNDCPAQSVLLTSNADLHLVQNPSD